MTGFCWKRKSSSKLQDLTDLTLTKPMLDLTFWFRWEPSDFFEFWINFMERRFLFSSCEQGTVMKEPPSSPIKVPWSHPCHRQATWHVDPWSSHHDDSCGGGWPSPSMREKMETNHQIWWLHLDLHHPHLHIPENLKQNDPSYLRVMGEQFWSLQGGGPLRCSGAYDQDKTQKLHEGLMRSFCRSHRIISNPYSANHLPLEGTSPKSYPMFFRR